MPSFSSFFGRRKDADAVNQVVKLPIENIHSNRYQPRVTFDPAAISELAQTIKEHGLLQPISVRKDGEDNYEIIAGERRYRAAKSLDWTEIPAIIQPLNDQEMASMALIENLQRSELTAIEEAKAYQQLMEMNQMTQGVLAEKVGKSQSFIANKLRLLKLSDSVQTAILNREITERHGRALLKLNEVQQQIALHAVLFNDLNVHQTEEYVAGMLQPAEPETTNVTEETEATQTTETKTPAETDEKATEPAKKPRKKRRKKGQISDQRIAINTINQTVKLVKENGIPVSMNSNDDGDEYVITIKIAKPKS